MCSSIPVFSKDKQSDVIKIQTEGERKKQQKTSMKQAERKQNYELLFFELNLYTHISPSQQKKKLY